MFACNSRAAGSGAVNTEEEAEEDEEGDRMGCETEGAGVGDAA